VEEYTAKIFKSLGHPIRLGVIKKLGEKRLCVCELKKDLEFSQPNLSQHLRLLKDSGVLIAEKKGLNVIYQVKDKKFLQAIDIIERMIK
jgi:DNA-binding transcriptional ArsR family regulator